MIPKIVTMNIGVSWSNLTSTFFQPGVAIAHQLDMIVCRLLLWPKIDWKIHAVRWDLCLLWFVCFCWMLLLCGGCGGWCLAFRKEDMQVDDGYISKPELIEFPTASGETAYGFYYPPSNADFSAEGGAPPLLVKAHGGPTSQTSIVFNAALQFWTSRGFAVFLGEKLKTFFSFLVRCWTNMFIILFEVVLFGGIWYEAFSQNCY